MAKREHCVRTAGNLVLHDLERNPGIAALRSDGQLLHDLAKDIDAGKVVEIGTYRGYSGIWIALALRATGGHLTTYEIDPEIAAVAQGNFRRAGVDNLVTIIVGDAREEFLKSVGPFDLAFIEVDKEGYFDYLQKLVPRMRVGGLIVADNIRMTGVHLYMSGVAANPNLETRYFRDGKITEVRTGDSKMAITRKLR